MMTNKIRQLSLAKVIATAEHGICFLLQDVHGEQFLCPLSEEALNQIPGALDNAKIALSMHQEAAAKGCATIATTLQ